MRKKIEKKKKISFKKKFFLQLFLFILEIVRLPTNVLILKGAETMQCLQTLFEKENSNKLIQRLALNCISSIISLQPPQLLKEEKYMNFILNIFVGVLSDDSKNRKSCITSIFQLLEKEESEIANAVENLFNEFCTKNLNFTKDGWKNIIYTLELIKYCSGKLKKKVIIIFFFITFIFIYNPFFFFDKIRHSSIFSKNNWRF